MAPRPVDIDEVLAGMSPPALAPPCIVRRRAEATQGLSGVDRLRDHPVQALPYDGGAVEVDGVDEALGAVDGPAVGDGAVEQRRRVGQQPAGGGGTAGVVEVREQPGPLQLVADGDAVRAERVVGPVAVVVGQHEPARVIVLRQPEAGPRRDLVHDPPGQSEGAVEGPPPHPHVVGREQRLDEVHVGIGAQIGLGVLPVAVQHVAVEAGDGVEEPLLQHRHGLLEHRPGALVPGCHGRGRRQQHERVLVGALRLTVLPGAVRAGEPPAVPLIVEYAGERGDPVLDQVSGRRGVVALRKRQHVGHSAADPGLDRSHRDQPTRFVQPAETARGVPRRRGVPDEQAPLFLHPLRRR